MQLIGEINEWLLMIRMYSKAKRIVWQKNRTDKKENLYQSLFFDIVSRRYAHTNDILYDSGVLRFDRIKLINGYLSITTFNSSIYVHMMQSSIYFTKHVQLAPFVSSNTLYDVHEGVFLWVIGSIGSDWVRMGQCL
jgi:hypothetical protein